MTEILVPIAQKFNIELGWARAATAMQRVRPSDVVTYAGGRNRKPETVLFNHLGSQHMIVGGGVVEAAELEDMIYEMVERDNERLKKYGRTLPPELIFGALGVDREKRFNDQLEEILERDRLRQKNWRTLYDQKTGKEL